MTIPTKTTNGELTLLRENQAKISGETIIYKLCEISIDDSSQYAVFIRKGCESDAGFVGSKREEAENIYNTLYSNTVTPCSLFDIICDFRREIY